MSREIASQIALTLMGIYVTCATSAAVYIGVTLGMWYGIVFWFSLCFVMWSLKGVVR